MPSSSPVVYRQFIRDSRRWDDDRVTYICVGRDPREVAMSWDNHQTNQDRDATLKARSAALAGEEPPPPGRDPAHRPPIAKDRLWAWVDDPTPPAVAACTLSLTLHHVETFWSVRDRPNIVMLHYGDLRADLEGQMRWLSARLGITVAADRWPVLLDAATLPRMRERADLLAPNATEGIRHDNREFFHGGSSGGWRDMLDDEDLRRYRRRVNRLTPPDLAAWVHQDPSWTTGT